MLLCWGLRILAAVQSVVCPKRVLATPRPNMSTPHQVGSWLIMVPQRQVTAARAPADAVLRILAILVSLNLLH
jgi:hypothetical protein